MKKSQYGSEIVKVQGSKLRSSDPYWNTDQGDYIPSEEKHLKCRTGSDLIVGRVRPER